MSDRWSKELVLRWLSEMDDARDVLEVIERANTRLDALLGDRPKSISIAMTARSPVIPLSDFTSIGSLEEVRNEVNKQIGRLRFAHNERYRRRR